MKKLINRNQIKEIKICDECLLSLHDYYYFYIKEDKIKKSFFFKKNIIKKGWYSYTNHFFEEDYNSKVDENSIINFYERENIKAVYRNNSFYSLSCIKVNMINSSQPLKFYFSSYDITKEKFNKLQDYINDKYLNDFFDIDNLLKE